VGAAHLAGRNFAQSGFARAGFVNWHNSWRGRFPHPNPGFRNWWDMAGTPVFWPFAYDVLYADLFWPWYYDYPFWAYGYPDLYGALFWPYGDDDLGLPPTGPETCFVGISFHHFRTTLRAIVRSSLAQAFSSDGEGFAIRGEGVPVEPNQGRNVHLTEQQAFQLAQNVLAEYELRTGGAPLRAVLHKTSHFDTAERGGFAAALKDIPIVSMVTLVPSLFRLLRYGAYPPKVGTVCTISADRSFLFTSGFMPELGTYPGPHVPQPFEESSDG
jgi:hypothetical protein